MARQIIILDQPGLPSDLRYYVAFWLAVPTARQPFYANAALKSRVIGITAPELSALQNGQFIEHVEEASYPLGTGLPAIGADLVRRFDEQQSMLNAQNPWNRYGTFYDGTSWTQITVA
jgi:hypothetical protein